jgi:hypothetical protein
LEFGNQSGVRVCDSVWVAKPESWGISELELEEHRRDSMYLYRLTDDGWVEKDPNLRKKNEDTRLSLGVFHCWKGMFSVVSPSLDGPAQ